MSKASEWARLHERIKHEVEELEEQRWGDHERKKPIFQLPGRMGTTTIVSQAIIDDDYGLRVSVGGTRMSPEQALALAHWILDTFGETP